MPEIDFGFNGNVTSNEDTINEKNTEEVTNIDTDAKVDDKGNPIVDINESEDKTIEDNKDTEENKNDEKLEAGTVIEFDNNKYTVDENGNIVDKDGNIFKEADKVNDWLKSLENNIKEDTDDTNVIDIASIQKVLGVELQDENGKAIEFENTPEGVANYVKSYVESSRQAIQEATIDALYAKYPIIEDVLNYFVANGNSLEGFNELKDRSTITLDINNEAQCETIIREAWKEEARKGSVDSYIQYLKSQNLLGSTAEEELNALIEKDKEAKEQLSKEAAEKERAYIEDQRKYWNDINKRVTTDKRIGKYQIPDTIIRTHNGQRISATPNDFFNYIYQVDKYGRSQYENDLIAQAKQDPESRIIDDMIAAYLKFTGGNYESLVNMAINEQKIKTIKINSKVANKPKVKVISPVKPKDKTIDFGY